METIKNYLETMFQNLPSTPQVLKAKAELYSMMEDKYSELIREGKTENEAVGTVISEFGNLDELAGALGIDHIAKEQNAYAGQNRILIPDEINDFLDASRISSLLTAVGVALCILSPVPLIFFDALKSDAGEIAGVIILLLLVAAGTASLIYSRITSSKWDYIKKEHCMLDYSSIHFVKEEKNKYNGTYAILLTIGIVLCILCAVPAIIIDQIKWLSPFLDNASGALVLVIVAAGVFLIIWASMRMGAYQSLLALNDISDKPNEKQDNSPDRKEKYENTVVDSILSVYWSTVTCIYFIWSFLTFDWHITWIIWPIASIVRKIIKNIWGGEKS